MKGGILVSTNPYLHRHVRMLRSNRSWALLAKAEDLRFPTILLVDESIINPFRAPKPLPMLIPSDLYPKRVSSCEGVNRWG